MKRKGILDGYWAGALLVLGLLTFPAFGQTPTPVPPTPTSTPTFTPTPWVIAGTSMYSICNGTANGDCGGLTQPASPAQNPAEMYLFQGVGTWKAKIRLWRSLDGGNTRSTLAYLDGPGAAVSFPVCGPCLIGATITSYSSGTVVVTASVNGSASMRAIATPTPTSTPTP